METVASLIYYEQANLQFLPFWLTFWFKTLHMCAWTALKYVTLALNEPASTPRPMAQSKHNPMGKFPQPINLDETNSKWNHRHHLPFPSMLLN